MYTVKNILIYFITLVMSLSTQAKEVSIAYIDWEPYYGKHLPNEGPVGEIVSTAFKRAGYEPKTQFLPWSRAFKKVEDGEIDILLGVYFTLERSTIYEYSDVIAYVNVGLVSHANLGIKEYKSMLDLTPYTIGISQNWANSEAFDSARYLKKDPAKNQILTIKKLLHRRVDMIAVSHEVFKHEMRRMNKDINSFTFIEPRLSRSSLHISSGKKNKNHRRFIEAFNQAFQSMKKDGTYAEILKRHNVESASILTRTSESAE